MKMMNGWGLKIAGQDIPGAATCEYSGIKKEIPAIGVESTL
jgi:hypothetical protein